MTAFAVLCGGESTRFGSHKILAEIAGAPSGTHLVEAARSAGLSPILAVTGPGGPASHELAPLGFDAILDDTKHRPADARGPLCGVAAALSTTSARTVFAPGDHPAIPGSLLRHLASHRAPAISVDENPLLCALDAELLALATGRILDGKTGVRAFLRAAHASVVGQGALLMLDPFGGRKLGFNTQEQLQSVALAMQGRTHAPGFLWALRPGQQAPQQRGPLRPR